MQQVRKSAILVRSNTFPRKSPLDEQPNKILDKLPSNLDLLKPILVGLLSAEPGDAMFDGIGKKAAKSFRFRCALLEVACNPVLNESVRANAAYALARGANEHKFSINHGKRAFERLLHSADYEIRFCGAYALMQSDIDYFKNTTIEKLSELVLHGKYGWSAAELLRRDLHACGELRMKHYPLVEVLVKEHAPSIRADSPTDDVLRQRLLGALEKFVKLE